MIGYMEMGFNAVKMKLGRLSPKEDSLRVKAAREAIGPDSLLFLDANNAYQARNPYLPLDKIAQRCILREGSPPPSIFPHRGSKLARSAFAHRGSSPETSLMDSLFRAS